jgi:diguanylate cyclase (GGDEF)-like protein
MIGAVPLVEGSQRMEPRPAWVPTPVGRPTVRQRLADAVAELRVELGEPWAPSFREAAASGERLTAALRLGLVAGLLTLLLASRRAAAVALAWAAAVAALVWRRYRVWYGFASSLGDVTLISVALAAAAAAGTTPATAPVVFDLYFLAVGCAALRYDWRVCAATGGLAVTQYAALAAYTPLWAGALPAWGALAERLALLVAATALAVAVVLRGQRLRRLSTTDRLTGLANRARFDERLAEEALRARRHRRPWSLVLLDIDHYKRFNDSYGHVAGDRALRHVADRLQRALRASDLVARYGGEEFVVLLPETVPEHAAGRLDALRREIAGEPVPLPGTPRGARLTLSAGVASWPEDGATPEAVLQVADMRLYVAKQSGRNRLVRRAG